MSGGKRALQPLNSTGEAPTKRRPPYRSSFRGNEENLEDFCFEKCCLVCGSVKDRLKSRKLSILQLQGRRNLLTVASELVGTENLLRRIQILKDTDRRTTEGKFHKLCYKEFTYNKKIKNVTFEQKQALGRVAATCESTGSITVDLANTPLSPHLAVATDVLHDIQESLNSKKIYFLSQVTDMFKKKFTVKYPGSNYDQMDVGRAKVKQWLQRAGGDAITFHSMGPGRADIMCQKGLPLADILHFCMEGKITDNFEYVSCASDDFSEAACLQKSALILQSKIDEMPTTVKYPTPDQCSVEYSMNKFIPPDVLAFFKNVLTTPSINGEVKPTDTQLTMAVTAAEVVIFGRRRTQKNQVLPPAHVGLAAAISFENGSKKLIQELHSLGLTISYDEIRRLVTAIGNEELGDGTYVPSNVVPIGDGGLLLQEYDDNIDINTETVDGNNTAHFMGRVIFQMQLKNQLVMPHGSVHRQRRRSLDVKKCEMPQFQLLDFLKLPEKPEPKCFVGALQTILQLKSLATMPVVKDLLWVLLRGYSRGLLTFAPPNLDTQKIPFWTAFNSRTGKPDDRVTRVAYLPSIDHRPADARTVYTTMMRGQETAKALGQSYHIHTMDMQLYIVGQQVKMSLPEKFPPSCTVLRLGGFHTASVFISCIGKLWGDAGLRDILVDARLYAGISADQMLKGKQFHRAVRGLTICYEVLMNLFLENFQAWLMAQGDSNALDSLFELVHTAHVAYTQGVPRGEEMKRSENTIAESFISLLQTFEKYGRLHIPTFSFWSDCLYAIQILLSFIRAERESDWQGHLISTCAMLPFFFVCDKTNYARWTPLYVLEMTSKLPEEIKKAFEDGHHSVKLTPGVFKGLFTDIAGEMTVVRDMKDTKSGIVGYSREEKGLLLWVLIRHYMAAYSSAIRERCGRAQSGWHDDCEDGKMHEQETASWLKRDEKDVQKALNFVKSSMADPFSASCRTDRLIHIGNGCHALPHIQKSLTNALAKGEEQLQLFVTQRLETEPIARNTKFHQTLPHSGLKTFADMLKPTTIRINGVPLSRTVSADVVYKRGLEVKKHRGDEFDLKELLKLPMTGVPSAIFKPDGSLRKTNKSAFLKVLEKVTETKCALSDPLLDDMVQFREPVIPTHHTTIRIVDIMAELQKLKTERMDLFSDLGDHFVTFCKKSLVRCDQLHLVFDRYDDEVCPKDIERLQRYTGGAQTYEIEAGRRLPEWEKIMSSNDNKFAVTRFLSSYIEDKLVLSLPEGKSVVLGGGYRLRTVTKVVTKGASEVKSFLSCNHSEADTRIIFHGLQACLFAMTDSTVIVSSPDTDVLVLLTAHYHRFPPKTRVWFETGAPGLYTNRHRFIPVHRIAIQLERQFKNICDALIAIYILTGCDTVSSFYAIGKSQAYKALLALSPAERYELQFFGVGTEASMAAALKFICLLYDLQCHHKRVHHCVNSLREKLTMVRPSVEKLPPPKPALDPHMLRSQWQAHIHLNAHESQIPFKDPLKHGWIMEEDGIKPVYFTGMTGLELLQKYFCKCKSKKPCTTTVCPCKLNSLPCCNICLCDDCPNYSDHPIDDDDVDESIIDE